MSRAKDAGTVSADLQKELEQLVHKVSSEANFGLTMRQISLRPDPTSLMHRAALMVTISAFETLIGALVESFMRKSPHHAAIQEKEFSLAELIAAGDLKIVIESALTKRVENILRGGLTSWEKWFDEQGVSFKNLCVDWDKVIEIFERRHAYVHTGGKVNPSYHHKVDRSMPVGALLSIDEEYLQAALGQIICLGNLITSRFLPKVETSLPQLAISGISLLYFDELMELNQWSTVEKMARMLKNDDMELDIKLQVRCFEWLATKKLHGIRKIEQQVSGWDTSALKAHHAFRKAALLEDMEEMKNILSRAYLRGEPWVASIEKTSEVMHQEAVLSFVSTVKSELSG